MGFLRGFGASSHIINPLRAEVHVNEKYQQMLYNLFVDRCKVYKAHYQIAKRLYICLFVCVFVCLLFFFLVFFFGGDGDL